MKPSAEESRPRSALPDLPLPSPLPCVSSAPSYPTPTHNKYAQASAALDPALQPDICSAGPCTPRCPVPSPLPNHLPPPPTYQTPLPTSGQHLTTVSPSLHRTKSPYPIYRHRLPTRHPYQYRTHAGASPEKWFGQGVPIQCSGLRPPLLRNGLVGCSSDHRWDRFGRV
jgi:hypothetical protein